ncbi:MULTISPECIES: outer membrane beta-barrel protein [Aestuariivivens]|uniref:outer membrane beta-barrel protein n=1 Tax=Aestuariivivens TaxID=1820275 RepID=UPI001CC08EE1|nr:MULTISPECIES: outer membrane beta-barrel protein [Aestuariivivens]
MKRIILALTVAFISLSSIAQEPSFTIEASQLASTFKFVDSDNNKLNSDYQSIFTGAYGIGYRNIFENNIMLKAGLGKRNGGANYVYDNTNYSWRLEYAELKVGGGYMLKRRMFSPYAVLNAYYGHLLRGTQVLNNEEFNITESGILKKSDFGLIGNIGLNFKISNFISAYAEGLYLFGLSNIEEDSGQTTANRSFGISLGLAFNLTE